MGEPYAPRSPDLSAIPPYPSSTTQQHPPTKQPYPYSSYSINQPHQQPSYPSYHAPPQYLPQHHHDPYSAPHSNYEIPPQQQQQQHATRQQRGSRAPKIEPDDMPWMPQSDHHSAHPRSQGPKQSSKASSATQKKERIPAPGELEGIVVKTHFPVARIKRIVQADEDVGKVAQVTPVVVSKALELFMISLTLKAAAVARSKSSKRITAAHLKQAVLADTQFDFLSEIVGKVADAPVSKEVGVAKKEGDEGEGSGDEYGGEGAGKGKRKRVPGGAGRRRGKVVSDDE